MIDALFWVSFIALVGSTFWTVGRSRGRLNVATFVPLGWILLIPLPTILRPFTVHTGLFPQGFQGTPRTNFYLAIALANVTLVGLQVFLSSRAFARLSSAIRHWLPDRASSETPRGSRRLEYWFYGLTAVAVGLALLHLWLMPRIPASDLVTGFSNAYQTALDRENADKLLPAPALLKYAFAWNSGILLPLLFTLSILRGWRWRAVFIGVFGLAYLAAPLWRFPSMLFVLAPFVALAIRDSRPFWSRTLIVGLFLSLLPPVAIGQAPAVSTSIHRAFGMAPPAAVAVDSTAAADTGCASDPNLLPPLTPRSFDIVRTPLALTDLVFRRILVVPSEISYAWFAYFPAVHEFLGGAGWQPLNVLSPHYRNPSNMVGLWAYCGHGARLPSVSAYGSFIADGWGELGYLGVLLACLGLFLFAVLIELTRLFAQNVFCLTAYAIGLLLFTSLPPRAGVLATILSSGLWLIPVLVVGYLIATPRQGEAPVQGVAARQLV